MTTNPFESSPSVLPNQKSSLNHPMAFIDAPLPLLPHLTVQFRGAPKPFQNHGKMQLLCTIIWLIMSLVNIKDLSQLNIFARGIKSSVLDAAKCECLFLHPPVALAV